MSVKCWNTYEIDYNCNEETHSDLRSFFLMRIQIYGLKVDLTKDEVKEPFTFENKDLKLHFDNGYLCIKERSSYDIESHFGGAEVIMMKQSNDLFDSLNGLKDFLDKFKEYHEDFELEAIETQMYGETDYWEEETERNL